MIMTSTLSLNHLIQEIENLCNQKSTGKLTISTDNVVGEIHFCSGKLVYVIKQNQRVRCWKRILEKYFHKKNYDSELSNVDNNKLWECEFLNKAILNRELSLIETKNLIRELFVECLFELSILKDFNYQWQSSSQVNSPLPLALALSLPEFNSLIHIVINNRKQWTSAGLGEFNLNSSPKLKNKKLFHSAKVSSHYLNGHYTLWDIAAKENKSITEITSYLFNLIDKNVIEFQPIDDLFSNSSSNVNAQNNAQNTYKSFKTQESKNQTIAIIDDNSKIINKLTKTLEDSGYRVIIINEPMAGMSKLMEEKPNLILLDTHMPTVDGYSVCKFLKTTPLFAKTPIVLLTDYENASESDYANFVGANDVIPKPVETQELISIVERLLPLSFNHHQSHQSTDLMAA